MKSYAKWSGQESQAAFRMYDEGLPVREIARRLARSQNAVSSRLQIRNRLFRAMVELAVTPVPRVTITKVDVPEFYAAGWRFAGFEHGTIVFEWPHDCPAVYPWREMAEVA
jgi:hypothetical protein